MTVYNTLVPVVHLVEAKDAESAVSQLRLALLASGFEPYDGDGGGNAFVSESGTEAEPLPQNRRLT